MYILVNFILQVEGIYDAFADDLPVSKHVYGNEIRRWKTRWAMTEERPTILLEALNQTNMDAYPSVYIILSVLLTMPATSASCERSFSSMRRIKTYLRSTMTGERLSALGLLNIHRDRDIDVDRIINTFASTKCRNMEFM